ncbi:odorant receptor 49b-like [Anthonomus grandis grandis]|uniref:odorant receptor 49b-like n=1 Tax=Anthonomus grandis grandis TaxID=2921223 RepID=UPI002166A40B|nr:odorant receptor 49b-like [Anthonomus grandis grandis]
MAITIYPKSEHIKISMIFSSFLGLFPWEFMFVKNPLLQKTYAAYSKLIFSYTLFLIGTAYIELFFIFQRGNVRMEELSHNLTVTLIETITVIRQLIMKFSPGFKHILRHIINSEEKVMKSKDQKLIKIYLDCATDTRNKTLLYMAILLAISVLYAIRPILRGSYIQKVGNDTVLLKTLPLSIWMPFDTQTYYARAYLWQMFFCLVGGSFVAYTDIFMFNLISYPSGQLKMLHHQLSNFDLYKQKNKIKHQLQDDNAASVTFIWFIKEHQEIIKYIDYFNDAMSMLMVFDFLQSSLQIASIFTQVNDLTLKMFIFVAVCFIGMIIRLVLYYYYANELIILSIGLGDAIWKSNWYEQPKAVKFMIQIFILRTQKPLKFFIGPFAVMSLESFISILKATYSYVTLFMRRHINN